MTTPTPSESFAPSDIPKGYCQCGCGEKTRISPKTKTTRGEVKGQPQRFLRGHAGRVIYGTVEERFWRKVDKRGDDGCWIWTGATHPAGYGRFNTAPKVQRPSHRLAYEWLVGPIPEGMVIDHLCRTPACVNPAHLEPVFQRENIRRGWGGDLVVACPAGHPYDEENTAFTKEGHRQCRQCKKEADIRCRQRKAGLDVPLRRMGRPPGPPRQPSVPSNER